MFFCFIMIYFDERVEIKKHWHIIYCYLLHDWRVKSLGTFSQRTNLNSEIILHENCTWEFVTRKHVGYSFGWLYFMEKCLKLWHWYGGNTLYQLSLGSFQSNSFFCLRFLHFPLAKHAYNNSERVHRVLTTCNVIM